MCAACGLGFACGRLASDGGRGTLPAAGSPRDDGSGLLAEASIGPMMGSDDKPGGAGGNTYGYSHDYGGTGYGGASYGGTRYGGTAYSNYRFEPTYESAMPPAAYGAGYSTATVDKPGTIVGDVSWPRPPSIARKIPRTGAGCDDMINTTLEASSGHVAGAVVYLEDIRRGRAHPDQGQSRRLQTGGLVVRRRCELNPRVQVIAPIGAALSVTTLDAGMQRLTVERLDGGASVTVELRGAGSMREVRLDAAGLFRVSTEGQATSGAWVAVAAHPYYTQTDAQGRFQLDDVPPGTYTLAVWHPPLYLGDGKWTEARTIRRKVSVKPHAATKVGIAIK